MQRCYLDGLAEDESVPFSWREDDGEVTPGMAGPTVRTGVDIGAQVLDLSKMRAELEAERARQDGG